MPAGTPVPEILETPLFTLAGLIDEGETPESAAIRELEEETGYKADEVVESSTLTVCDPGPSEILNVPSMLHPCIFIGMTTANMKLVVLKVTLDDKLETPEPKLEAGEFIVSRVVPLSKLSDTLKGSLDSVQ